MFCLVKHEVAVPAATLVFSFSLYPSRWSQADVGTGARGCLQRRWSLCPADRATRAVRRAAAAGAWETTEATRRPDVCSQPEQETLEKRPRPDVLGFSGLFFFWSATCIAMTQNPTAFSGLFLHPSG